MMKRTALVQVARAELKAWHALPPGLVMAILFAFIHRVTTGESLEESFFRKTDVVTDYEI